MKLSNVLITFVFFVSLTNCNQSREKTQINQVPIIDSNHLILGNWIRNSHSGFIQFNLKNNGSIHLDFGNDKTEIISSFELNNDTIIVKDIKGAKCQGQGVYKIYLNQYYVAFDLIKDNCSDRIKAMMGFWTRPGYQEMVNEITKKLANSSEPKLNLSRARIYLAVGKVKKAQFDLDIYIDSDTTDARAYINRAATKFPYDFKGIISDCNKAIAIDPQNKNAYFLRGLAKYEMGEEENACADFHKAIQLGFSILKTAEREKCIKVWKKLGIQFNK